MKKWMPIRGDFIPSGENVVFQGEKLSSDKSSTYNVLMEQNVPSGIILFEDMISNGVIEVTVTFEELGKDDLAQIVFNYQNDLCYMCAGIGNTLAKYGFNYINGQANTIYSTGFMEELPATQFDMKLHLTGSFLELYVNSIKVLSSAIPFLVNRTHTGILVKSRRKVTISGFKTDYMRPEVFVISQFGGDYDVLHDEVIKPVCTKLHYDPIRGDEVASCSMILSDIITSIQNAAVIIADITPDNPNVFYEIGYAHALKKPTILLCDKALRDRLPFDVSGFRTIFYDNSIGGKRRVEEKLEVYLQNINNSLGVPGGSIV